MYDHLTGDGFGRSRFGVVVMADPRFAAEAEESVALAGGRVVATVGFAAAAPLIGREGEAPVMFVDTRGVSVECLAEALPRIDSVATALDRLIVAVLDEAQIDPVAAMLLGPRVQMLCDPNGGERVAALAIAARLAAETVLADRVREGEGERLRRLNEEVARIAEALFRLSGRSGTEAGGVADRRRDYGTPRGIAAAPIDPQAVRAAIRARRLRASFFDAGLVEDPAWDMLLDLFAAELEGIRVSVSSLCIASAVAPTTALRWIAKMTELGLLVRHPDPLDRRRAYMALSASASEAMRCYVDAIARHGLSIA